MRVFALFTAALILLFADGCRDADVKPDHQAEWRGVLEHKRAAAAPEASVEHKQRYADSVRAFVEKHPNHGRAREVWHRIQLEFADELMALDRPHEAVRFYRNVLLNDPRNEHAGRGWEEAATRLAVPRERFASLEAGMSQSEVAGVVGRPMPGWIEKHHRRSVDFEAWYYRTTGGALAGVYFRNGKMIAAETTSNARIGRLAS